MASNGYDKMLKALLGDNWKETSYGKMLLEEVTDQLVLETLEELREQYGNTEDEVRPSSKLH